MDKKSERTPPDERSRRGFLKSAATLAASAAVALGVPPARRASAAPVIRWKIQTAWDEDTLGFREFRKLCARIKDITRGKLVIESASRGTLVGDSEMFNAVKAGILDGMHAFHTHLSRNLPGVEFLTSYPLGLDRPEEWETWYHVLGGGDMAEKAFGKHHMVSLAPIHGSMHVIHSIVPIRSFEDFRGKKIQLPRGMVSDFYRAAGAVPVHLPESKVYEALQQKTIHAADSPGASLTYDRGFGEIAKYLILGPPSLPCLHMGAEVMGLYVNAQRWKALPPALRDRVRLAVREHAWNQYTHLRKADLEAVRKMQAEQGVHVVRLPEETAARFRKLAPPIWTAYAHKSTLGKKALASQQAFMNSPLVGKGGGYIEKSKEKS